MIRIAILLLLLSACSGAPVSPTPDDAADELRDQLAKEPDDPRRVTVVEKLAQVELGRARLSNTIVAYKRFLAEFPVGDEAVTARALLEGLRFDQAQKTNTVDGWEAFLADHPRGRHEADARNALGTLEIAAALKSSDQTLVHVTLARFPDHSDRAPLVAHEDDLAWTAASNAGNDAIEAYLASHPSGAHRAGAEQHKEDNQQNEIRDAEDLSRALALTSRADATESQRALVAGLQLNFALRRLDFAALKGLAATKSVEPSALAIAARAKEALQAFEARPLTPDQRALLAAAAPGAGLRTHEAVLAAVQTGDPLLRTAALKELAEWANPDDLKFLLGALQGDYLGVRLEAIEALRTLATSLKPETWQSLRRTRENELLSKELTIGIWRQIAALRDADGRTADAATAWRAVIALDASDLVARARLFALAQQSTDRIGAGSTARDLAKEAIEFADNRWTPPRQAKDDQRQGKGRVIGVAGNLTILRQICVALELGTRAAKALGALSTDAPVQEQQLFNLAKMDAETALDRIRSRRAELERAIRGEDPSYPPCESDPSAETIQASRRTRSEAIRRLGQAGDARLLPVVEGLAYTPGKDVRASAVEAASLLRKAATK